MSTTVKKATAASWKKAAVHTVTLATGTVVDIKLPDLPALLRTGQLPNNLIDAAIAAAGGESKVDRQFVEEQGEFVDKLVILTVVDPVLSEEDVKDIPVEDKELLAELATRQRDFDALGHHISGLHTNSDWRKFRGFDSLDEDVEGL